MIYVASKVRHAQMWKIYRDRGYPINSTWIDEARDKESPSLSNLWRRCIEEASTAKVVVAYAGPDDVMKGALVEIGAALAHLVPVYYVGPPYGSWHSHSLVRWFDAVPLAMEAAMQVINPSAYDRLRTRAKVMADRQDHYADTSLYPNRTPEDRRCFQYASFLLRNLLREFP